MRVSARAASERDYPHRRWTSSKGVREDSANTGTGPFSQPEDDRAPGPNPGGRSQAFPRALGFENVELEHAYDFALSFAGEDRPLADALYELLDADDYVVFYDCNEQARIVGEDVEAFLAPIYRSDSRFVIAVLGRTYGERRWTIFESEQFKERFDEGHVIPIWDKNAVP